MPEAAALELDGVEVRYGSVSAVRDLTLRVGKGEIVGLIGPNGAGKSTTLNAIMGLQPAHRGEIKLNGQALRRRSVESIARAGIALVPEGRRIFGDFTVEENLRLGLAARRPHARSRRRRAADDPRAGRRGRHREDHRGLPRLMSVLASIDLQTLGDAFGLGAIYALMAVGIGLVFGVLRLVNFAYGQLIMAGAYTLAYTSGWPVVASIVSCFAVVVALSLAMDRVVFRPLRSSSP